MKNKPYQKEARAERLLIFDPDAVQCVIVELENNYAWEKIHWSQTKDGLNAVQVAQLVGSTAIKLFITFLNYFRPKMHKPYCEVKCEVNTTMCQRSSCSRKWRRVCDSDCIHKCCLHICACFTYYCVSLLLQHRYCATSIRDCFTCRTSTYEEDNVTASASNKRRLR